ncbi:hypothetical protein PTSG_06617 [Salpingoeca rosetta]|uniref:Malectin domain-containing protein n=1 Tax=Salpingoeca rosetta (strain ATCC 50818 / BSB-021) TaxID=946362 RepID=F2UFH9_SALR5|nr:uncharacterized protein PTSG_06617 [Salpingoeca rosetta]EGD75547.1 hypothetical protein PTSG_06617 [Salpingoeca rosetta]|eukprot:XP_004992004.1 hypothetical protein PTSG_06617 [Salpingoeca rosetta]
MRSVWLFTTTTAVVASVLIALLIAPSVAARNYTCFRTCPQGNLSACDTALDSQHENWYIDAAPTTASVRIAGDWQHVEDDGASLQVTSSSAYLGGYFLDDRDQDKGEKSVTFTMRVPLPGTYKVFLLHPASDVAASAVPVGITSFQANDVAVGVDRKVDQRTQSHPDLGGTYLGTFTNVSTHIVVAVTTTNTHVETDNFLGNHVLVDGLLLQPTEVDVCGLLTTTTTTAASQSTGGGASTAGRTSTAEATAAPATTTRPGLTAGGSATFIESDAFIIIACAAGFLMVCGLIVLVVMWRVSRNRNAVDDNKDKDGDKKAQGEGAVVEVDGEQTGVVRAVSVAIIDDEFLDQGAIWEWDRVDCKDSKA